MKFIIYIHITYNMGIRNIHVWELLPWDIQVDILSRLSTKDLRSVEGICKDWQCIIKSPRFHMLQINANSNQDAIRMVTVKEYRKNLPIIQHLCFNDTYKFFNSVVNLQENFDYDAIVAVSNGLLLMEDMSSIWNSIQFLVYNPITTEYVRLPQLSCCSILECDFFEHDIKSNS